MSSHWLNGVKCELPESCRKVCISIPQKKPIFLLLGVILLSASEDCTVACSADCKKTGISRFFDKMGRGTDKTGAISTLFLSYFNMKAHRVELLQWKSFVRFTCGWVVFWVLRSFVPYRCSSPVLARFPMEARSQRITGIMMMR